MTLRQVQGVFQGLFEENCAFEQEGVFTVQWFVGAIRRIAPYALTDWWNPSRVSIINCVAIYRGTYMLTRRQKWYMGIWVGSPLILFVVLTIINPGYMDDHFNAIGPVTGFTLVIGLQVVNYLILYGGLRNINLRVPEDEQKRRSNLQGALLLLTMILFTLPSLWLVVLYPAIVYTLETGAAGIA
jgi:hypothetical protein